MAYYNKEDFEEVGSLLKDVKHPEFYIYSFIYLFLVFLIVFMG